MKDAEKPAEHPVDAHISRVAGRVRRFFEAPLLEYAPEIDMAQTARQEALFQFGPGELILAHVHDGKSWSEDQMVVWLPPDGEFGR